MRTLTLCLAAASVAVAAPPPPPPRQPGTAWKIHDRARPRPPVVTPPPQADPAPPPSDAVVLFNGKDLSGWKGETGGAAGWNVEAGALVIVPGAGGIATTRAFGDMQLHLEWMSPVPAVGKGQGRGNSGVHLMGLYEVQILDSYGNETYADGQAAAIYGEYPPLVNACRPPGEWQSYDICFRAPRFSPSGALVEAARVTVIHNGVLVQSGVDVLGPTVWLHYQPYQAHAAKLPLSLQEHGSPVRFRNLWVRELVESRPAAIRQEPPVSRRDVDPARYVGTYRARMGSREESVTVTSTRSRLYFGIPFRKQSLEMVPLSRTEFTLRTTDASLVFDLPPAGPAASFTFSVAGDAAFTAQRLPQ